jgi:hypothetical protein
MQADKSKKPPAPGAPGEGDEKLEDVRLNAKGWDIWWK